MLTTPAWGAASPAPLAGTTVAAGSRSAVVAVRLPRAVTLDVFADVTMHAPRGRMSALVLKKDGAWNAPYVMVVNTGYCAKSGCVTAFPNGKLGHIWAPGTTNGTSGVLPAGNYRLYLVTDGGSVTVTLKLRGLSGSRRITPRTPARASVSAPRPTVAEPAVSPALFAGGGTHRTPASGGVNATAVWKDVPAFGPPSAVGMCDYAGPAPAGSLPAYQLPCAGGNGDVPPGVPSQFSSGPTTTPIGPGRFLSAINAGYLLPQGTHSIGGYHNTAGPVTAAYVHQLWLDF
ncbi:MAG TPA: hypothetical protein VNQ77_20535 [Frankiaceae bacterium]|nr:hypothetical protein [Frankiaceae bacterium]